MLPCLWYKSGKQEHALDSEEKFRNGKKENNSHSQAVVDKMQAGGKALQWI